PTVTDAFLVAAGLMTVRAQEVTVPGPLMIPQDDIITRIVAQEMNGEERATRSRSSIEPPFPSPSPPIPYLRPMPRSHGNIDGPSSVNPVVCDGGAGLSSSNESLRSGECR